MHEEQRRIGRRDFLKRGAGAAAAVSAVRAAAGTTEARAESVPASPAPPDFIIDAHYHWGGGDDWAEETVRTYRAHHAMACTLTWMDDLDAMNEARAAYPDVFIPYGRVNLDDPNAVREVQTFHEHGFAGMKFHSPQKNWDDPSYFQVYRLCEEFGMHMLFHTGISSRRNIDGEPRWGSPSRMRPMYLDTICRQFPNATVQGAHFGNPWYDEAAEAARWNPNLYFDITGSTLYKLIHLDQLDRLGEVLWWADWGGEDNPHTLQGGPTAWQHILFATDEGPSGLPGNIERFQLMMDVNDVPESDRNRMWGLQMAEILGIDPATKRRI